MPITITTTPTYNIKDDEMMDKTLFEVQTLNNKTPITFKDNNNWEERIWNISEISPFNNLIIDTKGQTHAIISMESTTKKSPSLKTENKPLWLENKLLKSENERLLIEQKNLISDYNKLTREFSVIEKKNRIIEEIVVIIEKWFAWMYYRKENQDIVSLKQIKIEIEKIRLKIINFEIINNSKWFVSNLKTSLDINLLVENFINDLEKSTTWIAWTNFLKNTNLRILREKINLFIKSVRKNIKITEIN